MFDLWGIAAIASKWALYVGVLGAAGTVICMAVFGLERVRGYAAGFAILGLLAALLSFMLKGVALTGDASGMTDPDMLGLLWETQNGTALLAQVIGLVLVLAGSALGRFGRIPAVIGGLVAVGSFAMIGHIPDRDNLGLTLILFAHLVGVAFWIGILSPLRAAALDRDNLHAAAHLGDRFGRIASFVVPGLIIAGGVMIYVLLGTPAALIGTAYGQALMMKIILVAALLGLAAINKLRYVPRLERGDVTAGRKLARSIGLEWVAVLAILAVTALLTSSLTLPM